MKSEKNTTVKHFWSLFQQSKHDLRDVYLYAILIGLVQLSFPLGIQALLNFVLGGRMVSSLYLLIAVIILGVSLAGIFQLKQMKIIERIQQVIFVDYAQAFAAFLPKIDLQKNDSVYWPEKVNRMFEVVSLQKSISKLFLEIPIAIIQILFGLILVSIYHPAFIVFGILLLLIVVLLIRFTFNSGLYTNTKESTYKYEVIAWFEEMARVIKSFKYSNGTNLNFQKTDTNVTNYLNARTSHFKVLLVQYRALVVFKVLIIAGLLVIGTLLMLNNKMNIGAFVAAEIAIVAVMASVEKLMSSLESIYDAFTSLEKIDYVLNASVETAGTLAFSNSGRGVEVEVKDLTFHYAGKEDPVLNKLNITIPAGNRAAIIGSDGAGKTTLLKVLTGSYQNFEGNILINAIPLKNYELDSYRNRIGIYLNNMEIFNGTLRENITLGRADISMDEIMHLIQKLGFNNLLDHFEHGFDTQLEPLGKKWSSTIIRQVMLLRAFCVKGELLLLEEPWIGMDEKFKNNIIRFLCEDLKNTTVIIVTNDGKYLANCQTIIHL